MNGPASRPIVIAGAGIAGLTAALAFAQRGFPVRIFEKAPHLEEIGAGLQLSPNATRLLERLGVLDHLRPHAVRPQAVVLRSAATLKELARVPLGDHAERRWGAPYLVAHRADLQTALLEQVSRMRGIEITTGADVRNSVAADPGVRLTVDCGGRSEDMEALLLVGADGVWSLTRQVLSPGAKSRFAGELAWRATIEEDGPAGGTLSKLGAPGVVTALLHPGAHLIVYPVRAGRAYNLVAFTPGRAAAEDWSGRADKSNLLKALRGAAPELNQLADTAGPWTVWPIHTAPSGIPWTRDGRIALIGDAAHAMTPFAAQGAAMAIEDAVTLAAAAPAWRGGNLPQRLAAWEKARRPRVERVARRGALNRFAWHAGGPVALARNLFLAFRSPAALAADLDWLYGWELPEG